MNPASSSSVTIIESRSGRGRRRDRGHEHRPSARDVEAGERPVVRELSRHLRSVRVHAVGEGSESREVGVGRRADLTLVDAPVRIGHRDRPDEEERRTAPSARLEVRELRVRDRAVRVGERVAHRRHEDAVAQLEAPDGAGREQHGERGHGPNLLE